jgi:hypothetical protein
MERAEARKTETMTLHWTTLRPIGNSWPARLTIIIPLIGYFIIFNDALAQRNPPFTNDKAAGYAFG